MMECDHLNFVFKNGENGQGCRKWVWRARYKQIVHSIWVFFPLDQNIDCSNKLHQKLFMTQHLIMWFWMVDMLSQALLLMDIFVVLIIIALVIQLSINLTLKIFLIICLIFMLLKMLPNLPLQLLTIYMCAINFVVWSILICVSSWHHGTMTCFSCCWGGWILMHLHHLWFVLFKCCCLICSWQCASFCTCI